MMMTITRYPVIEVDVHIEMNYAVRVVHQMNEDVLFNISKSFPCPILCNLLTNCHTLVLEDELLYLSFSLTDCIVHCEFIASVATYQR